MHTYSRLINQLMNYKESQIILNKITKAETILLNCHRGPDADAIGSALALYGVLTKMGKKVSIICPSEKIYEAAKFLKNYEEIQSRVDFYKFGFARFDLFITLDSSSWGMVAEKAPTPEIPIIVIDHHHTNDRYGKINLVDDKISSVGELLYLVFEDWKVKLNKDISEALLTAIIGDTGIFKYPNTTEQTFNIAHNLMKHGADKEEIIARIYRSLDFNLLRFWGETLARLKLDKKHRFVYSAVPYEVYSKLGKPEYAKESACDLFAQTTEGTDFGIMALEVEEKKLSLSFRSRTNFDSSLVASMLGGGGHAAASGAKIEGLDFDRAVMKVLQVARKIAKEKLLK